MNALELEWADERFVLFAARALFWRRVETLIVADTHFGKAAAFRSAGIPTPAGTTHADLARLDRLIETTGAKRLIVLGDFLHARAGRARDVLAQIRGWRQRRLDLEVTIVRGNHDCRAGDPPRSWGIRCVDPPLLEPPLAFCHDPVDARARRRFHVLAGHVHPCVALEVPTGHSMRAACFHFRPRIGVLPAFGSFTGMHRVSPREGDRVFVIGDGEIAEAAGVMRRRAG